MFIMYSLVRMPVKYDLGTPHLSYKALNLDALSETAKPGSCVKQVWHDKDPSLLKGHNPIGLNIAALYLYW